MGKSLEEYAAQHPAQDLPQQRQAAAISAQTYMDRQQAREQAEQLKESILQQLEQGNAPQCILYTALKVIGLLSNDEEWTKAGREALDKVYADLAQQSLFNDNAAIATRRLDAIQAEYNAKLRRQLQRSLNGYNRIERALQEALQAVDALDPPQEPGI